MTGPVDERDDPAGVTVPDGDGTPGGGLLDMSRRGFLRTGSLGVAAAGLVASVPALPGLIGSLEADAPGGAPAVTEAATEVEGDAAGAGQPIVAHLSDVASGEVRLFVGNQTLTVRDPQLAAQLARAVRAAGG